MTPFLLILSSPSGAGKTTIARALLAARDDVGYSISATTRPPRPGEKDGVDYYFVTEDEFRRKRDAGEFLEWAEYSGYLYGTLRSEVDRVLASGKHVVLDIDVQGARAIRERRDDVVSIFILPPSVEELLARLGGRGGNPPADLERRLRRAVEEVECAAEYDYIIVNADRTQAVAEVAAILEAEGRKTSRQADLLAGLGRFQRELIQAADRLSGK
ncbi:Guanylate kinase [bacterium HR33]|nr:Guanylate kinase [bacterium HR33]